MKRLQHFSTTKTIIMAVMLFLPITLRAQESGETNKADFTIGNGLNFSFNEGEYEFNLGGFVQPIVLNEKVTGLDTENSFNSKRSFLQFSGKAKKEKVSFLFQLDYSLSDPLLDAWIAYHLSEATTISVGQKQTFVNNREMMYREDRLQFNNRSLLSQNLSATGREFGLFIESKFGKKIGGDILENKKTFLYLKAIEFLGHENKSQLLALYSNNNISEEKIIKAKVLFKESTKSTKPSPLRSLGSSVL